MTRFLKGHRSLLEIGAVWVLALLLHLPFLGAIPAGLNRDEAALGYNAYSLVKTGRDEHGQRWPLSLASFGDQKLPGYVYSLLPVVAVTGLQVWAIRLPSLVAGLVVIAAMHSIAGSVAKNWGWSDTQQSWLARITIILIAISPWSNHFSRVAYEAHLAMAFFTVSAAWYWQALAQKRVAAQRWRLLAASLGLVLATLTYHSYQVLVPLVIVGWLLLDRKQWPQLDKKSLVAAGTVLLIGGLLVASLTWQANRTKSIGISPFQKTDLQRANALYRQNLQGIPILPKLAFNSLTEATWRFGTNLTSLASPDFFFVRGTAQSDHNPGGQANHHLFLALFWFIGLGLLWEKRRQAGSQKIGWWLLAAMVAPALTIQPQHTTRFSPAFPIIELISAMGLVWISTQLKGWQQKVMIGLLVVIGTWSVAKNMIQYWWLAPATYPGHQQSHLLGQALVKYSALGREVITQSPETSPYIWYLFESQLDPADFLANHQRYPTDAEGFQHVKRIHNISFEKIAWDELIARTSGGKQFYLIFKPEEVPAEWRDKPMLKYLESIEYRGQVIYEVWLLNP